MIPRVFGSATKRPGTEKIVVGNGAACYYEEPTVDPAKIQIYTFADLMKIGVDGSYPRTGDYQLMNNIDASGESFTPICTIGLPFVGTFDGEYFQVSNISYDAANSQAGFFLASNSSTIENLTLTDMSITNCGSGCALLCSNDLGTTTATNVHVSGSMSGSQLNICGGIFSTSNSNMSICSADVDITSTRSSLIQTGGLVGTCGGNIINCYSRGSITWNGVGTGLDTIGGLCGWLTGTNQSITNVYSAAEISGTINSNVGGMFGKGGGGTPVYTSNYWDGSIITDYSLDDIGDDGDVAGITEKTTSQMYRQSTYSGWDFSTIWNIVEGSDYPRLKWQLEADKRLVCQPI